MSNSSNCIIFNRERVSHDNLCIMSRVILIGTIFLLLSTMSFGQSKKTWEKTKSVNTIAGYENFILKYPNRKYTALAKKNLEELTFIIAEGENTIESYESFLQHWKNSSYTSEANQRLGILYMERDWIKTIETNEIIEYEMFLRQYANSPHIQEVTVRKQLLEKQWDDLEELLLEGSVQSLNDYCEKNPNSPYLPKARAAIQEMEKGRDIMDLLNEGKIEIKTQGQGIENVSISIRKLVQHPIIVRVPVSSFFVSERQSAQNMVTTAQHDVRLSDNDWQTVTVSAACANRLKNIPGDNDRFIVQRSPHQDELARLIPSLDKAGVDFATRQAAVWIVTDDADYSDLGTLVSKSQLFINFSGTRVIKEAAVARAMKICADAGINIYDKQIWSDRQKIFAGLEDDELKKLIKDLQAEEAPFRTKLRAEEAVVRAKLQAEEPAVRSKLLASVKWIDIPAGIFVMGSPTRSDETQHRVTFNSFKMSKYEVTFDQYDAFCEATGLNKPEDNGWGRGKRPVINVSWHDATAFAEWMGCRLPTEAEWEYTCLAGTTTPFNTGTCLDITQANYNGNFPYTGCSKGDYRQKTMPVGSFYPNAWVLYDMHGNVYEWCSDWYGPYPTKAQTNPIGPSSGSGRVIRGGSWLGDAYFCRSACRNYLNPGTRNNSVGFRLVFPK